MRNEIPFPTSLWIVLLDSVLMSYGKNKKRGRFWNISPYLNYEFLCVEYITKISRLQLNMVFCICIRPSVKYPSFLGEKFEISRPANSFLGSSSCACNSNKTVALGKVGR